MSGKSYDTAIIGGGIIGLFTAWELAKAGQSVCVLERGEIGREASWAAGGILSPLRPWNYPDAVNALAMWSQARYASICDELQQLTDIDCEWRQGGMLILDCPEIDQARAWATEYQFELQTVTAAWVAKHYPQLGHLADEVQAVYLPSVAQLRNPRLLKALHKALMHHAVEIREHCQAESIDIGEGRFRAVVTDQGQVEAERVVVAAGAWSEQLLPGTGRYSQTRPVKGQMLLYRQGTCGPATVIMRGDQYLVPRNDGGLIVGSSVETSGFDKSVSKETGIQLQAFAVSLLPELQGIKPDQQWAGLRPATEDEIPVIGPHADIEGLFINTGHYRSGIVMAPAAARLMADQILQQTPIIPVEAYQA